MFEVIFYGLYGLGSHGMKITIKSPFGICFFLLFPSIVAMQIQVNLKALVPMP